MTEKSILIIGAGVAGLCAGIYARMNGYQARIYEQHRIPGGLVTAWKRKGYLVDLCVHWMAGSGPGLHLNRYWNEVGLLDGRRFFEHDRYGVYHARDGRTLNFYADPQRLEQHLLELAPEDAGAIHKFVEGVRFAIRFNPPAKEQYEAGTLDWMKTVFGMLPMLKDLQKWSRLTVGELAQTFQSSLIRQALTTIWEPDFSAFFMIFSSLAFIYKKQAGYPLGGSLPIALDLEKRFRDLGGSVQYRAVVRKILVENDRAVGIELEDGAQERADIVISAADGYGTVFRMLEGRYLDAQLRRRYSSWKPFPSMLSVSAGVNRIFPDIDVAVEGNAFELQRPVQIAGKEHTCVGVRVHKEDPQFAPPGKTVLTSAILTDYEFWKNLAGDRSAYEVEKEKVSRAYIEALEQVWPGISSQVEMIDVSTPLTFERFTGNWKGSITGWKLTPEQAMAKVPRSLPGLENFWMVGHWVYPGGGLPGGVSSGREVIWRQCRKDGKKFRA